MALRDPAPDSFFVSVPQAEDQLRIVEEQRKIHEERMKLEQDRQKQQKEEQKIILGKGKSRPKLSFTLKATE